MKTEYSENLKSGNPSTLYMRIVELMVGMYSLGIWSATHSLLSSNPPFLLLNVFKAESIISCSGLSTMAFVSERYCQWSARDCCRWSLTMILVSAVRRAAAAVEWPPLGLEVHYFIGKAFCATLLMTPIILIKQKVV